MSPKPTRGLFAFAALVATVALPSSAFSQYRLPTITSIASPDSIHQEAVAMSRNYKQWRQAAILHRQSAAMRQPNDSMAYRCLTSAAALSFGVKDLAGAQRDKVDAATQAMARGDVEKAAQAFADAAWIANERRRTDEVRTLAQQAEVLASSPFLNVSQRNGILRRFVHVRAAGPNLASQAAR